jgi:hypothetical protein
MGNYVQTISGHAFVPSIPGPNNFANVGDIDWTHQQGYGVLQGRRFRIVPNVMASFFAPITNPVIFNDIRLSANFAAVTLSLQPQDAFLNEFRVIDRLTTVFERTGLNVTGDFSNVWVTGSNAFDLPDRPVDGHLVIQVTIKTDAFADVTFTGAGIRFHD